MAKTPDELEKMGRRIIWQSLGVAALAAVAMAMADGLALWLRIGIPILIAAMAVPTGWALKRTAEQQRERDPD